MYRRRGIAGTTLDVFLRFSLTGRDTPARPTRVARISWTLEWEHLYDRSLLPVDSSPVSLLRRTASPCRGGGEAEFGRRMTDAWCNAERRNRLGTRGFLVPLNLSAWETGRRESTVSQKNALFYHWMVNSNKLSFVRGHWNLSSRLWIGEREREREREREICFAKIFEICFFSDNENFF